MTWSPRMPWFPPVDYDLGEFLPEGEAKATVEEVTDARFVVRVWSKLCNASVTFHKETWSGTTGAERMPWFERALHIAHQQCVEREKRIVEKFAKEKSEAMDAADTQRRKRWGL
jgi:hypothetical protein